MKFDELDAFVTALFNCPLPEGSSVMLTDHGISVTLPAGHSVAEVAPAAPAGEERLYYWHELYEAAAEATPVTVVVWEGEEPLGLWSLVKGLLLLAVGLILIVALSEAGVI